MLLDNWRFILGLNMCIKSTCAEVALRDLQPGVKITLHYDSATRSKIDGDWPALILIFSDSH